jgi:hypothetical protein
MELCGGEHAELSSVELRKRKDRQTAVSLLEFTLACQILSDCVQRRLNFCFQRCRNMRTKMSPMKIAEVNSLRRKDCTLWISRPQICISCRVSLVTKWLGESNFQTNPNVHRVVRARFFSWTKPSAPRTQASWKCYQERCQVITSKKKHIWQRELFTAKRCC